MIIGYKTKFKNGTPTNFVDRIMCERKKHTIRLGFRWKAGIKIQMATGVRTKDYWCFNNINNWKLLTGLTVVYEDKNGNQFFAMVKDFDKIQVCTGVQSIQIDNNDRLGKRVFVSRESDPILNFQLTEHEIAKLAWNDGFDSVSDFWNYFNEDFYGQIIHWTDLRY